MNTRAYPRGLAPGQHCPCNGTGVIEHSGGASLEVCEHAVYFADAASLAECLGTPRCHGQTPVEHVPACPLFLLPAGRL